MIMRVGGTLNGKKKRNDDNNCARIISQFIFYNDIL